MRASISQISQSLEKSVNRLNPAIVKILYCIYALMARAAASNTLSAVRMPSPRYLSKPIDTERFYHSV